MRDLTGKTFGYRKVIKFSHLGENWTAYWVVKCICGKTSLVRSGALVNEGLKSCGCKNIRNTSHKKSKSPEYTAWQGMKERVLNKKRQFYKHYGKRGITICKRWLISFENFLKDMGKKPTIKHTLDRIDNNGSYCKSNCRWATRKQQSRNRRNNHLIMYKGKKRSLAEIAELNNISSLVLNSRLRIGFSLKKALSQPVKKRNGW